MGAGDRDLGSGGIALLDPTGEIGIVRFLGLRRLTKVLKYSIQWRKYSTSWSYSWREW